MSDGSADGRQARAVVLVQNPVAPYSRAIRIARALRDEGFSVEIAATAGPGLPESEDRDGIVLRRYPPSLKGAPTEQRAPGTPRSLLRRSVMALRDAVRWPRRMRRALSWPPPRIRPWIGNLARDLAPADLYHGCGVHTLLPALAARDRAAAGRRAIVIYDVVDDFFESVAVESMPRLGRLLRARREASAARRSDAVVTANRGLAEPLATRWRLPRPLVVIDNYPEAPDPSLLGADRLRGALGLGRSTPVILYQGRLNKGRCLDELAEAVLQLPQGVLVLLGFGPWFDRMRERDRDPRFAGRHFTLPAVDPDELLTWTVGADVSAIILEPGPTNFHRTTPNKLWESAVAGVPVVVSASSTTMAEVVMAHDLGRVAASEQPSDVAAAMASILEMPVESRLEWRTAIAARARSEFSWQAAAERYRALVRELTDPGSSRAAD